MLRTTSAVRSRAMFSEIDVDPGYSLNAGK